MMNIEGIFLRIMNCEEKLFHISVIFDKGNNILTKHFCCLMTKHTMDLQMAAVFLCTAS